MGAHSMRNRLGFMLLGLCNNFSFNVMLSAANDLMSQISELHHPHNHTTQEGEEFCNDMSSSAVLLADILPALCLQIIYPMTLMKLSKHSKVLVTFSLACAAYSITAFATSSTSVMLGVGAASLAGALGEMTFISGSVFYGPEALGGWSVGVGWAGLASSAIYAILRRVLSLRATMILILVVPVIMLLDNWFIIIPIGSEINSGQDDKSKRPDMIPAEAETKTPLEIGKNQMKIEDNPNQEPGCCPQLRMKISFLLNLVDCTLPIMIIYLFTYFTNSGLIELCYFTDVSYLDKPAQYRWMLVGYQFGSLLSRISIIFMRFKNLWILTGLQPINTALLLGHATMMIKLPSFYVALCIVFFEGCLTGLCYANIYTNLGDKVKGRDYEVGVSIVAIAESLGVVAAGLLAFPTHDKLCELYKSIEL